MSILPSSFRCVTNGRPDSGPTGRFAFSFLYFVIVVNSLVLDVFFYGRIINYMRKNSVRVMVVAVTREERTKEGRQAGRPAGPSVSN